MQLTWSRLCPLIDSRRQGKNIGPMGINQACHIGMIEEKQSRLIQLARCGTLVNHVDIISGGGAFNSLNYF